MAARRSRNDRRPSIDWDDWREMTPALALLGAVVGVIVLTALLRAPADDVAQRASNRVVPPAEVDLGASGGLDEEPSSSSEPSIPDPPAAGTTAPPTEAEPTDDLEARALVDHGRLRAHGEGHTLQLLVACDPANVRKLIDRLGTTESLYVLPFDLDGRRCYRACWGTFPDREQAVADRTLPADLVEDLGRPTPKEISLVTP
jgi:hypothetical protein